MEKQLKLLQDNCTCKSVEDPYCSYCANYVANTVEHLREVTWQTQGDEVHNFGQDFEKDRARVLDEKKNPIKYVKINTDKITYLDCGCALNSQGFIYKCKDFGNFVTGNCQYIPF